MHTHAHNGAALLQPAGNSEVHAHMQLFLASRKPTKETHMHTAFLARWENLTYMYAHQGN